MPVSAVNKDSDVSARLAPAVEHIRGTFADQDLKCWVTTQFWCYAVLHGQVDEIPDAHEYRAALGDLKACLGPVALDGFYKLIRENGEPGCLKAFFELYQTAMALQVRRTFDEMHEIGLANQKKLRTAPIDWAESQVNEMIERASLGISLWLKRCCDTDSNVEADDLLWTSWRAPMTVFPRAPLYLTVGKSQVWERYDERNTRSIEKWFTNAFRLRLEIYLKKCSGEAHVDAAKVVGASGAGLKHGDVLNYRSELKNAVRIQLTQRQKASDLEICRGLDSDGEVEIPSTWTTRGNRLFECSYHDIHFRSKIQSFFSKVRADLRKAGILPQR